MEKGCMTERKLLAVVSTAKENRIRCQHQGCNHPVYVAIHVVLDDSKLKVIGSTCFKQGYPDLHSKAELTDRFGEKGRKLSDEELEMLKRNTAQLVAQLEDEYQAYIAEEKRRIAELEQQQREAQQLRLHAIALQQSQREEAARLTQEEAEKRWHEFNEKVAKRTAELMRYAAQEDRSRTLPASSWVNPKKSALALRLKDGTSWVRCEDLNGHQRLIPVTLGELQDWTLGLPTRYASPDFSTRSFMVKNVVDALFILRTRGVLFECVFASFQQAITAAKDVT